MGSLDDSSLHEAGSEHCANRKRKRHRRRKKSSARTITPAYELEEAVTDEADTVVEEYLQKKPISFSLECANESKTQKKKDQCTKICGDAIKDSCAYAKSENFAENHDSSLNRHTQISDGTVQAQHRHKKHKKVKNPRDFESDAFHIRDAPCVMQCEQAQTDVEKDQSIAELEVCGKIDDIAVERKKQKKNTHCGAEKHYSSLNRHTQISGDSVEALHGHKKHKKVKNLRDSESDGNENKAVPCAMQREKAQTDVEKEDQTIAELEDCNKIDDIAVEQKKQKKNKPCDAEYTSCRDEMDTLFSDENLNSTSGRVHKKKKYKTSIESHAQATNGSALSDLRENCRDKCSTFSGKSDWILSDAGSNQNCTLQTPHKKKRREVSKENSQEGTSCNLSAQQMDDCENNETCRSIDDRCCSTGAVRKKKTRKLKLVVECADGLSDCALSSPTEKQSDNASFIGVAGESSQMGNELKKQSEMVLQTSLHEFGESPLKCSDGDCITQERSSAQEVLGAGLKKKKRKLARLSAFGSEFYTVPLQSDANSSETAGKSSKGGEVIASENCDTVPSADLDSANKNLKLRGQDTPGTSYKLLSSAESSQECSEHASRSLKGALYKPQRSDSPPDPDFLVYVNGEHRFPSIHHKTKPPLETIRRYEEETGLTIDTGKYTAEEDFILLKNIHEIAKYYNIVYPHMIVGHCGEQDPALQKEVKDLVRKEQLIRLLGRGLPRRTIHSAYMRARLLLDPLSAPKKLVLTLEQKERLQQMYNQLGPKWTVMAQKMGLPAEQLRSAFRYVKEKETFATGKWEKSEDELLRQAVQRQTGGSTAKLKVINWQAVSQYVRSRNALQCRRHWTLTQVAPPPGQETQKWDKFDSIHLICIMHKLNASRSAEVDWETVGNSFPWAPSPLVAKYHWESTLNYYLPPEQRDNFKSKVKNLYEIALPSLLEKYGEGRTLEEIIKLSKSATA